MPSPEPWTFRRLTRADFALVADWLAQPEVARWWRHEWTPEALERDFGPSTDGDEPNEDWLAVLGGEPVGLIQRSRVADYAENLEDFSALGTVPDGALTIDYLVGVRRSTGLGTAMISAFTDRTWHDFPDAPAVLVTVVAANRPSWRALERAGFHIVAEGDVPPENPLDDSRHFLRRLDRPSAASSTSTDDAARWSGFIA